jgi:hypothetical protein
VAKNRLDRVLRVMDDMLNSCIIWIKLQAAKHNESALKEVLAVPEADLPKYAEDNKQFTLRRCIALARISKEDIADNPTYVMESLWNCTFDVTDYKAIGENDGMLKALERSYRALGLRKRAKVCATWMYNGD